MSTSMLEVVLIGQVVANDEEPLSRLPGAADLLTYLLTYAVWEVYCRQY